MIKNNKRIISSIFKKVTIIFFMLTIITAVGKSVVNAKENNRLISSLENSELVSCYDIADDEKNNYIKDIFIISIPTLCLLITYTLWASYGKDKKIEKKTNTYYPLKGLNSLEVAYIYQNNCDTNDVASLFIYLANNGFISIESIDKEDKKGNIIYKIKKLKEYDLKNENEKLLMDELFSKKEEITTDKLDGILGEIKDIIAKNCKEKNKDKDIYAGGEMLRKVYVSLLIIISIIAIIIVPRINIVKMFEMGDFIVILVITLLGITPAFLDINTKRAQKLELLAYMLIDIILVTAFVNYVKDDLILKRYLYETIYSGACLVVMFLLLYLMPKMKEEWARKYQRTVELREFIQSGKEKTISNLVKKDEEYFYKLLPYATALRLDNFWIEKFEGKISKWPKWMKKGNKKFDTGSFMNEYEELIRTLENHMD